MNCISCGHILPQPADPTERYIVCADCGSKNDLAGVDDRTQAAPKVRPPSRRSLLVNLVGRTLGNGMYRIDSEIGGGGMAKVYLATQLRLDRQVAVKVLPQELTEDPTFVVRFKREATVLAKFSHANIVPVFDTGEEEGIHYIVMGYIEAAGGKASTLRDLIDAEPLEPNHAIRIMEQSLSALQYAHEKSIIHRDIKPGNILIDAKGNAHLADFGIASARGASGDPTLTVSGSTLGTARYMAPEQTESASRADARSDIYSLGLVFYEMLIGYVPETKTFLPGNLLTTKKLNKPFVLPSAFKPGQIDERLDQIILRAIQPDPADRFQTASEMLAALSEAVGGKVSNPTRRSAAKRRSRVMQVAAAVVVLAGVAIAGQYFHTVRSRIPADMLEALKSGDNSAVIAMVDKDPGLVCRMDVDGLTPLHHAAAHNLSSAALELIKQGAKLEAQDLQGRTPLHLAALNNRTSMVVLLLDKGARQEAEDKTGKTPQQLAQENGKNEAVLVFERADLIQAIGKHDRPAIEKLVNREVAISTSEEGWTALHYAAYKGSEYATEILLKNGAPVDAQTTREYGLDVRYEVGRTPLLLACEFAKSGVGKYALVVDRLLKQGASPNLADAQGRTPLYYVAKNGDAEIARLLIKEKADPNARTKDEGSTPLQIAAQLGNVDVLEVLLTTGADPSVKNAKKLTALGLACSAGNAEIVKRLLQELTISNEDRMAARKLAEENKRAPVVALLDEWWTQALFAAIAQVPDPKELKTVSELLNWPDRHLGTTIRAGDGCTPLGAAVAMTQPSPELVDLLLKNDPKLVDQPDSNRESPLFLAVRGHKFDAVRQLAAKADRKGMGANDPRGQRLLNVAEAAGIDTAVVDLLVKQYQLALDQADAQGVTPLRVAAGRLDPGMVQDLLRLGAKADMVAMDVAVKAQLAAGWPSDTRTKTEQTLGVYLLMDQLQDPKATKATLSAIVAKLDALKLDVLDKPLPNGMLPLQLAILSASPEVPSWFIERASTLKILDKKNAAGETALHVAAAQGKEASVKALLTAGADYTLKDTLGRTAEDAATAAQQKQTALALSGWRTAVAANVEAERQRLAELEKKRLAELERQRLAEIEREKLVAIERERLVKAEADQRAKDAAVAVTWFDEISKKRKDLSIDSVGKLQSHSVLLGGMFWTIEGATARVGCSEHGILTVVVEGDELQNMGPGRVQDVARPSGNVRVVRQVPQYHIDRKTKIRVFDGMMDDTEPDGSTVTIHVHTYSGRLVPKPSGEFEWQVGDKSFSISVVK